VLEIWFGTDQLAEVFHEPERPLEIEIYPPTDDGKWIFELEALMPLLSRALRYLISCNLDGGEGSGLLMADLAGSQVFGSILEGKSVLGRTSEVVEC